MRFPDLSLEATQLDDVGSGAGIDITLQDALIVDAEAAEGYVVYPNAHVSGATLLHHALPDGLEDYVSFDSAPKTPAISYKLSLRNGVGGLRLVAGTLEMLDGAGVPRLRVAPPYIVGADGERTEATLAVEGCRVDKSPAAPWGRRVTPPGANNCTVRVSWNDEDVAYPAILDPRWTTTANAMVSARQDHTATLLSNGKVLVAGGRTSSTSTTGLTSAEILDPVTKSWAATGSMTGGRWSHTATQLNTSSNGTTSGRVLIAGGISGTASLNTAQLYNPAAGTFASAGNLNAARHLHSATLLPNGNVLAAGGMTNTTVLNNAAIYNPSSGSGSWTAVSTNMDTARRFHTATLLTSSNSAFNNMVLIAGGNSGGTSSVSTAQLFNPSTSAWTSTTALPAAREGHTATKLANGNVLITGGKTGTGSPLASTLLFTIPASGTGATWPSAGNMTAARVAHTATLLSASLATNGAQVVVAGGSTNGANPIAGAELWNGTTWTATTALPAAVQAHTATALGNGMVLIAGGNSGTNAVNTARLFDPSFANGCTTNSQCATGFCVIPNGSGSGVCCDTACTNQCTACNLTGLIGTCSPRPNGTTCSDSNACTSGDTCQAGNCGSGPPVICPGADQCHTVAACTPASGCLPPVLKADGTVCDDGNGTTEIDACRSGTCIGTADPAVVNGFEGLGRWSIGQGATATIVGLNANHTQGSRSLEVSGQNYIPFNSIRMATLGSVGPLVLLDILLPTQQANPDWFGSVQMFVSAPSVGINNAFLGQVELTGLPLATWQTLAFQLTPDQVTALSGSYIDLTFTVALNVPFNETGHYLLDNLRFSADILPTLQGIAKDSAGVTKAIFTYTTASASAINIPYGPANSLCDDVGFIHAPLELPPQQFVSSAHPPFVATLAKTQLTWTLGSHSATATQSSTQLPTETGSDGGKNAVLPDGTRVPLDTVASAVADVFVPSDVSFTTVDQERDFHQPNPIGPTSAGTMPGAFRVTDDGAAEYVVPLDTPAGRNGVEPQLSLVYNSRAGNGFLGPGWALRGLHRISRCKTTYAYANERDTDPAPVTYTSADAFCFDGERLISVGPGEYRTKRDIGSKFVVTSADSLGPISFQVFRRDGMIEYYGLDLNSRIERQRITSIAGNLPLIVSASFTTVRRDWLLAKVVDRFGNAMTVRYRQDFDSFFINGTNSPALGVGHTVLPDTISYTSNDVTGRAATKTVSFSYSSSSKAPVQKVESGVPTITGASLLASVVVSAPDPVKPHVVGTYKFVYEAPSITRRPVLTRIQRCGRDGVCVQPTVFTWEPGTWSFRHVASQISNFHPSTETYSDPVVRAREAKSRVLVAADFDGDGHDDLMYRTALFPTDFDHSVPLLRNTRLMVASGQGSGFGPASDSGINTVAAAQDDKFDPVTGNVFMKPVPLDIDGDGRADVVLVQGLDPGPNIRYLIDVFRSDGTAAFTRLPEGLTESQYRDPGFNPEAVSVTPSAVGPLFFPGDLNGDGRIDLTRPLDNAFFGFRPNVGGVLGTYQQVPGFDFGSIGVFVPWHFALSIGGETVLGMLAADLDGDGMSEVVMGRMACPNGTCTPTQTFAVHVPPRTLQTTLQLNLTGISQDESANFFSRTARTLDVNGDGLPDVVIKETSPTAARLWGNLGRVSGAAGGFLPVADLDPTIVEEGLVADLNNDGMDDIVVPGCAATLGGPTAKAYISAGNGDFTAVDLGIPSGLDFPADPRSGLSKHVCPHVLMDVDGDGQKDLVQPEVEDNVLHIYFRDGERPDRITGILNGLGASTSIEYGRAGLEPASVSCQYPKVCSGRQVEVVSGYTVSEGQVAIGQTDTTHYSMTYSGSAADALGGGWLGFSTTQKRNDRTRVTDTKQFDLITRIGNWYPHVGMPTVAATTYDLAGSGRKITRQRRTTFTDIPTNSVDQFGPYSVQPLKIDEREIEQAPGEPFDQNNAQRWTEQNYTYDELGNPKTHETIGKVTGTRDLVEYSVTNDFANWLIGKVDRITTTSTAASGETDQRQVAYSIDATTGVMAGKTIQPDDPTSQLTISYGRNPEGLVTSISEVPVSGASRFNRIDYDSIEGAWPSAYTNALGQVTRTAYHCGLGIVAAVTDANGVSTRYQYDGFGRRRAAFDPTGMSILQHYTRPDSNFGVVASWSDSTGRAGAVTSDNLGREIFGAETAFDGTHQRVSSRVYDAVSGRPQFVSRPFGATTGAVVPSTGSTFTYDEMGRMTSAAPAGESVRTIIYDRLKTTELVGDIEKGYRVEDGMGHAVLAAAIEPTSPAPNHEVQTRLDYGPFASLRHVTQPGGAVTTMSYDHLGRRTQIVDPDAGTRTTHFNAFGEIVREELPGQTDVVYDRDLLGRSFAVTSGDGVTSYQWDTAANGVGKLESEASPFAVLTHYAYQSNGLLATTTWNVAGTDFVFDWGYDAFGRPASITYPSTGGATRFGVALGYGGDGQLGSLSPASGGASFWSKGAVADDGQLFKESFGDGLLGLRDTDPVTGRVTHIATGSGDIIPEIGGGETFTNPVQSLGYQYLPDGKLLGRNDALLGAAETFSYDNLDRVTGWSVSSLQSEVTYGYDDTGNLTSRRESKPGGTTLEQYGYGVGAGPHALTSGPLGTVYGYDQAGRQTARPGQPLLSYTSFDLPKQIQQTIGGDVTFAYSAAGRRVRKTTASSDSITLEGLYERRIQSGATTHVLYLPGGVGQISCNSLGACGAPAFYHQDRLGTVDTITTNGAVVGRQKRDPFGRSYAPANFTDPSATVTLGFIGQTEDRETGLIDLNHRLYDATIGRFISPDPLVKSALDGQAYNRFAYARNNPLSFIDPSGLQEQSSDGTAPPPSGGDLPSAGQIADSEMPKANEGGLEFSTPVEGPRPLEVFPDGTVAYGTADSGILFTRSRAPDRGQQVDPEEPRTSSNFAESAVSPPSLPDPTAPPSAFASLANKFFFLERIGNSLTGPFGELGEQGTNVLHAAACIGAGCDADGVVEGSGPRRTGLQQALDVVTVVGAVLPLLRGGAAAAEAAGVAEEAAAGLPALPRSLGAAANITTTSRIGASSYATGLAEDLGQAAQRDVDALLRQLRAGNMNPGIGTRALGDGFFELRGANAGRVIVKQTGSASFDIVGKFQGHVRGDAANSAIIQRLMGGY